MKLRRYQREAVDILWAGLVSKVRQLCVLPTASGKGEILRELLELAAGYNVRSLLLLNRETLVTQFIGRLRNLSPAVYCASVGLKERDGIITIASIQSCYSNRFDGLRFIIIDEAHNIGEDGMYDKFLALHSDAKIIGFTATPFNERGYIHGSGKPFPRIDYQKTMDQMIADKWIVRPRSVCPPEKLDLAGIRVQRGDYVVSDIEERLTDSKVESQVRDALARMVGRKKIVWACCSIKHAERVRNVIQRFEDAAILHSRQGAYEKELHQKAFEEGAHRHMVTVMMLSEGYDYAPIDCVVLLRPTRSARLYVQVAGRALRLADGKEDALILDYGAVIENLGPLNNPYVHEPGKKGKGVKLELDFKLCPMCFEAAARAATTCDCGYEWPAREVGKGLSREAASIDILTAPPQVYQVDEVEIKQHKSKNGNDCVRVVYWSGLINVSEYFSKHPFSWAKGRTRLQHLTGFDIPTFQEAWDACGTLVADGLFEVETVRDGKYNKVTRVSRRASDSDVPF